MNPTWRTDRLYWRPSAPSTAARWHCFKKTREGDFVSLCGEVSRPLSGGAYLSRPPAQLRCARCDIAEMDRRGTEESLPESEDWRAALLSQPQPRKEP